MSTQIAIRLSDDLLAFLDEQVASGSAPSRADAVRQALEERRQRILAEKDIAILKVSRDPDLEAVTGAVSGTPLGL